MRITRTLGLVSLVLAGPALALGVAQDERGQIGERPQEPRLEGAQQLDQEPKLVMLNELSGTQIVSARDEQLGRVVDFVVDHQSGRGVYALVQPQKAPAGQGGQQGEAGQQGREGERQPVGQTTQTASNKPLVLPYRALQWNEEAKNFTTYLNAEDFQNLPQFDKRHLSVPGAIDDEPTDVQARAREAGGEEIGERETREAGAPTMDDKELTRLVLTSNLATAKVMANEQQIGTVQHMVVDAKTGAIAFVGASMSPSQGEPSGQAIAIPWQSAKVELADSRGQGGMQEREGERAGAGIGERGESGQAARVGQTAGDMKQNLALKLDKQQDELREAPKVQRASGQQYQDEAFRKSVYDFWGIDNPPF